MNSRLFYLACVLFLLPMAVKADIVIKGELPANPHSVIMLYRYADYISRAPVEITEVHTDGAGNFQVSIPDSVGPLVKLLVENRSLSFYILPGGQYAIRDLHNELQAQDLAGAPINRRLLEMDNELRSRWRPLFVDTASHEYRMTLPADSIVQQWRAIERKYAPDSTSADYTLLHYSAASSYLLLIHQLPDAQQRMNDFEAAYFNRAPIGERNPFYTSLLESYMKYRMIMLPVQRYHATVYDGVQQLIHEAACFPHARLRQLALVAGINQEYFIDREVKQREILNHRVQAELMDSIADPVIREMLQQVMSENNRARVGNKFPLLSLRNEKNEIVNLADIRSDLILVDFWATWCWGCVEGMKSFPDWLQQCGDKLTIVSISIDDNLEKMKAFMSKRGKLPGVLSLYNGRSGGYLDKLQLRGYPTYILLNKNRDIIAMPGYTSGVGELLKAAL